MVKQDTVWFKKSRAFVTLLYAVLFVLVGLFVFYEDNERQPVSEILRCGNLIPVAIYSGFPLWVSFGLYLMLSKIFNRFASLPLSILIGIPAGLIILDRLLRLVL